MDYSFENVSLHWITMTHLQKCSPGCFSLYHLNCRRLYLGTESYFLRQLPLLSKWDEMTICPKYHEFVPIIQWEPQEIKSPKSTFWPLFFHSKYSRLSAFPCDLRSLKAHEIASPFSVYCRQWSPWWRIRFVNVARIRNSNYGQLSQLNFEYKRSYHWRFQWLGCCADWCGGNLLNILSLSAVLVNDLTNVRELWERY